MSEMNLETKFGKKEREDKIISSMKKKTKWTKHRHYLMEHIDYYFIIMY